MKTIAHPTSNKCDGEIFAEKFTTIISTLVDLHANFGMYKHATTDEEKDQYSHKCEEIRGGMVDFISKVSCDYQFKMKERVRDLMFGCGILEDVAYAGLQDYWDSTLEEFLNDSLNDGYRMHNEIVMDAMMKSCGFKLRTVVDIPGGI